MRTAAAIILFLLPLGACNREPGFEERYARAETSIRDKAREIDAELARREQQASEAAAAQGQPSSPPTQANR